MQYRLNPNSAPFPSFKLRGFPGSPYNLHLTLKVFATIHDNKLIKSAIKIRIFATSDLFMVGTKSAILE